jgi:UrcA family protein
MKPYRMCAVLCGAALLCSAVLPVSQAADQQVTKIHVKYDRRSLATPEGAKKLYWRIRLAARLACHERDLRDISQSPDYRRCYEQAVGWAIDDVNSTQLTALAANEATHNR